MGKNKKGFTIVELVIVIAVIAILASVLVPTFSDIILKAKRNADTQVVRMLNEYIAIDLAGSENSKHDTMYQAVQACVENGIAPEKIAAKSDYNIAWESSTGNFVLLDMETSTVIFPQDSLSNREYTVVDADKIYYFVVTTYDNRIEEDSNFRYSIYAYGNDWPSEITIHSGFDAGDVKDINKITYFNETSTGRDVIIHTTSFSTKLVIKTSFDLVKHYGLAGLVEVENCYLDSFNEYGTVGRLYATSTTASCNINIKRNATVYQIEKNTGSSTKVSLELYSNVYDINGEVIDGEIISSETMFTTEKGSRISASLCKHNHGIEKLIDGNRTYEICKSCGYTLLEIFGKKNTVIDSNDDNVIVSNGTYFSKITKVTGKENGQILLADPSKYSEDDYLRFTSEAPDSSVSLSHSFDETCEYSLNGGKWTKVTCDSGYCLINLSDVGDYVLIRSRKDCCFDNDGVAMQILGKVSASGSVTSILDGKGTDSNIELRSGCFDNLFAYCYGLTSTPKFISMNIAAYCYYSMFRDCVSLVNASELPAMILADSCYSNMFSGCVSLIQAPELPATTLANLCYKNMFCSCYNLIKGPSILPANEVPTGAYCRMFQDCSSLIETPLLPATILSEGAYANMFEGCTSLVKICELPQALSFESNCYDDMFYGCISLRISTSGDEEHKIFTCNTVNKPRYDNTFGETANGSIDVTYGNTYYWCDPE